jgi:beta-phosphoglucomutase-like phosphatase (HAD superfamily)
MTGVIFDLDGTLWNISSICASAWNQAINIANIQRTPITEDDISRVSGLPFICDFWQGERSLYIIIFPHLHSPCIVKAAQ